MSNQSKGYYLPSPSSWPLKGSIALFCLLSGAANWLHGSDIGPYFVLIGFLLLIYVIYGWFGTVIKENRVGLLQDKQVDRSFRYGMVWFIFSEVMFFGAFFGALFYVRVVAVPMLGDPGIDHLLLWPDFKAHWPLLINPDQGLYIGPRSVMDAFGIPAINTLVLLTSGATITVAHWSLLKDHRKTMLISQLLTILLGIAFLLMQGHEYMEAYLEKGLTLGSGIYGTTFFLLTGFHGLHVTIGTIGLIVVLYRMIRRDFNSHNHFAFEAVSWYWHFVDVVWLLLFIFVYCI